MAKYIDAEKLKTDIERRINAKADSIPTHGDMSIEDYATLGGMASLQDLLSFLSTLESEKPTQEGLEEEMDRYFETMPVLEHENIFEDTYQMIARHFAEWGAEHRGSSETPNDLEEAADDAAYNFEKGPGCEDYTADLKYMFKAGAKWQKEQMKKETPEGMYDKEESEEGSEVQVPKTVDEAVSTLGRILSDEDREYLLENGAISMHDSLGRWIRNEWGLWTGSELKDELTGRGLDHPDDMSNYIIEEFIKYWNEKGKDI